MNTFATQKEALWEYSYDDTKFIENNDSKLIKNERVYSSKIPLRVNINRTNKLFQIPLIHNFINVKPFKKRNNVK